MLCEVIQERSSVKDVIAEYRKQKFRRARHLEGFTGSSQVVPVRMETTDWRRARSRTKWKFIVTFDVKNCRQPGQ